MRLEYLPSTAGADIRDIKTVGENEKGKGVPKEEQLFSSVGILKSRKRERERGREGGRERGYQGIIKARPAA